MRLSTLLVVSFSWLIWPMASGSLAADPTPSVPDDWAYKPLAVKADAKNASIDQFLRDRLASVKLTYAPAAEKRTWLRRVTYDLTGLPPTPEEIVAFEADQSPRAYEKVVDRLLASPRFGERVALWWLDVVRYAESDGFKADDARPNAWRYRDYVIASFNADKPYDRFVQEQLAGDELFPNDSNALIATGYLRHYPDEFNAVNLEQRRQEILNDLTDTTAAAFMGITLGCAKCHDHKTDPVSQQDYYRLQAFFAGYKPSDTPVLPKDELEEYEQQLKEWKAKTAELREEMEKLERPVREKAEKKERSRFPEEYVRMLDKPASERTPFEEQIAAMVAKQVYSERKFNPAQMKAADREKWEGMSKKMSEMAKSRPPVPPSAMAMTDVSPTPPPTRVLKRGDWRKPGEEVYPGFISVVDDRDAEVEPMPTGTSGRRAALARWITDRKNPFTARVMVNRIWQHLFGRGIVASSSDFGVTGERPTHPELLDWMASEFMNRNWSVKAMYRLIATSEAYRQSSQGSEAGSKVDPENRLLWQMPRKRLDGESLRDAMLSVAGSLNHKMYGPSILPELPIEVKAYGGWKMTEKETERNRRSIYVAVKRNIRYPLFTLFDSPDRCETCARRFQTTTAPQALGLLNDSIVLKMARQFADRVQKEAGQEIDSLLDRTYTLALNRLPTSEEREVMKSFLARGSSREEAVTDLCHSILNLNEFLYID